MTFPRDVYQILILFFVLFLGISTTHAHTYRSLDDDSTAAPASAAASPWSTDIVARILASQTGAQNWVEDGANTLNSTLGFDIKAEHTSSQWTQTHESRLVMGAIKQDSLDFRKATDEIRIRSSFRYKGDGFFKHVNPTLAADIRTQFAAGYNYKKNPFGDERKAPVKVSGFFAPATFTQSLGLTYTREEGFKYRLGVGAKQTVVGIERIRPLYNLPADQGTRFEMGVESRTQVDKELFENVRLKSSLGLFAAFNKPDLPDLLWENQVDMKINKWLGVNVEFKALYDRDISDVLQLKESFSLGVAYTLI